jgi:hypothetical protein
MAWKSLALAVAAFAFGAPAYAQDAQTDPYAPYTALIGEWDTGVGGNIVQRFSWGPEHAYVLYSTSTIDTGGAEHLHFEGIFLYNAAHRNMDFLVAVEPGSLGQEQGTLHVESDGSIAREVTLTNATGQVSHFRQTFRFRDGAVAETGLMRQSADGGWAPNFPGSDHLPMRRRAG